MVVKKNSYLKIFLSIIAVGISILIAVTLQDFRWELKLPQMSSKKEKETTAYAKYVKYSVISNIGMQNILKMEIAIPYEDMEQKRDLKRNIKKIKSDFFLTVDQSKMEEWVKQRDFAALKSEFLKIINRHTDKPVKDIYFKTFNYY